MKAAALWSNLERFKIHMPSFEGCGWCKETGKETKVHLVLECAAWARSRERILGDVRNRLLINGWDLNRIVEYLLGGDEVELRSEDLEQMISFLAKMHLQRRARIQRGY